MNKDKKEFDILISKLIELTTPGKAYVAKSGLIISSEAIDMAKNLYSHISQDIKNGSNDYRGFVQDISLLFKTIEYEPKNSKSMTSAEVSDFSKAVKDTEIAFIKAEKLINFVKQNKSLSKNKDFKEFLGDFNKAKENYQFFMNVYKTGSMNIDHIKIFKETEKRFELFNTRMNPILEGQGFKVANILAPEKEKMTKSVTFNGMELKDIVNKFSEKELKYVIENKDNLPYDFAGDLLKLAKERDADLQKQELSKALKKHKASSPLQPELHIILDDNATKKAKGLKKFVNMARELVGHDENKSDRKLNASSKINDLNIDNSLASHLKGIQFLTNIETQFTKADKIFKLADKSHKLLKDSDFKTLGNSNWELNTKLNKVVEIRDRFKINQSFSASDMKWLKDNIKPITQAVESNKKLLNEKGIKTDSIDKVKIDVKKVKADLTPKTDVKKSKGRE